MSFSNNPFRIVPVFELDCYVNWNIHMIAGPTKSPSTIISYNSYNSAADIAELSILGENPGTGKIDTRIVTVFRGDLAALPQPETNAQHRLISDPELSKNTASKLAPICWTAGQMIYLYRKHKLDVMRFLEFYSNGSTNMQTDLYAVTALQIFEKLVDFNPSLLKTRSHKKHMSSIENSMELPLMRQLHSTSLGL